MTFSKSQMVRPPSLKALSPKPSALESLLSQPRNTQPPSNPRNRHPAEASTKNTGWLGYHHTEYNITASTSKLLKLIQLVHKLQQPPTSWDMDVGQFMPVFLVSFLLGLEDSHVPTFWLLLHHMSDTPALLVHIAIKQQHPYSKLLASTVVSRT